MRGRTGTARTPSCALSSTSIRHVWRTLDGSFRRLGRLRASRRCWMPWLLTSCRWRRRRTSTAPWWKPAPHGVWACAASGTLLLVDHGRRFDPILRRLRDEIAAGDLGDVVQATAYYTAGLFN